MLIEASFMLPEASFTLPGASITLPVASFMMGTVQASLMIIIYDRKMFIVQATGASLAKRGFTRLSARIIEE
jgi:hypothetical protein